MATFIVMCCQVQLFPADDLENLGAPQRRSNRMEPSCYHPKKHQHEENGQNSGHNGRVEELLWKIAAK